MDIVPGKTDHRRGGHSHKANLQFPTAAEAVQLVDCEARCIQVHQQDILLQKESSRCSCEVRLPPASLLL
jgi:hypothetical protein